MLGWLTAIANRRLLVVLGFTYVLGYITWSIHAFRNGLGMLPALEAQYFVAGFIPMVIILSVYFASKGSVRFRKFYMKWVRSGIGTYRLKRSLIILALGLLLFYGTMLAYALIFPERTDEVSWTSPWSLLVIIFWILLYLFMPIPRVPKAKLFQWIHRSQLYGMIIAFGLIAINVHQAVLYPIIPQEFGGVRPRYAYLDIVLDQISIKTLQGIVPDNMTNANKQVVQSKLVEVYFSGRDVILVKPHGLKGRGTPTYELNLSIVKAVTWYSSNATLEQTPTSQ